MIDESLLAKVSSLGPADRLELIGKVWDTLSAEDIQLTEPDGKCSMRDSPTWKQIPTINARGHRLRPALNG